jgi:hypothetical protein
MDDLLAQVSLILEMISDGGASPCLGIQIFQGQRGNRCNERTMPQSSNETWILPSAIRTSFHRYHAVTRFIEAGLQPCGDPSFTKSQWSSLAGLAAANGYDGKTEAEILAELGGKFPKHIYYSTMCIGGKRSVANDHVSPQQSYRKLRQRLRRSQTSQRDRT